jgi:hypothetical protein
MADNAGLTLFVCFNYPSGDLWSRLEGRLIRFKVQTRIQQFLHDTKRDIYSFLLLKKN